MAILVTPETTAVVATIGAALAILVAIETTAVVATGVLLDVLIEIFAAIETAVVLSLRKKWLQITNQHHNTE